MHISFHKYDLVGDSGYHQLSFIFRSTKNSELNLKVKYSNIKVSIVM